jgi:hypothetical protein
MTIRHFIRRCPPETLACLYQTARRHTQDNSFNSRRRENKSWISWMHRGCDILERLYAMVIGRAEFTAGAHPDTRWRTFSGVQLVISDIPTAVTMKSAVFRNVAPCSLVEVHRCFGCTLPSSSRPKNKTRQATGRALNRTR